MKPIYSIHVYPKTIVVTGTPVPASHLSHIAFLMDAIVEHEEQVFFLNDPRLFEMARKHEPVLMVLSTSTLDAMHDLDTISEAEDTA